jgi:hypothetical protein
MRRYKAKVPPAKRDFSEVFVTGRLPSGASGLLPAEFKSTTGVCPVALYGDVVMPEFWPPENEQTEIIDMPTAIVKAYTSEGFVIGADGRCTQAESGIVVTDDAQKIFPLSESHRTLAYVFCGTTAITDVRDQTLVVDLTSEIHKSVATMSQTESKHDINWYVSKLWPAAYESLRTASRNHHIGRFCGAPDDPGLIAQVSFYGYYRGSPAELDLQFRHEN